MQHTLYAMGEAVLKSFESISGNPSGDAEINTTIWSILKPFGLENHNEICVPT